MAWDDYLYDWVDVGDSKVCPTCRRRGNEPPRLFNEWEATPGDGQSECDGYCRCIFLPHAIVEFDTSFEGGKTILMDLTNRRANFPISLTFEEQVFKQVDELVEEYEAITGNWNLPDLFYNQPGGDKKRDFLKDVISSIRKGKVEKELYNSILKTNRWIGSKLPLEIINGKSELIANFTRLLELRKKKLAELEKLPLWKKFNNESYTKGLQPSKIEKSFAPFRDYGLVDVDFFVRSGKVPHGEGKYINQFIRVNDEVYQKILEPPVFKNEGIYQVRYQKVNWERVDSNFLKTGKGELEYTGGTLFSYKKRI